MDRGDSSDYDRRMAGSINLRRKTMTIIVRDADTEEFLFRQQDGNVLEIGIKSLVDIRKIERLSITVED